jgi:hypothetical protein
MMEGNDLDDEDKQPGTTNETIETVNTVEEEETTMEQEPSRA